MLVRSWTAGQLQGTPEAQIFTTGSCALSSRRCLKTALQHAGGQCLAASAAWACIARRCGRSSTSWDSTERIDNSRRFSTFRYERMFVAERPIARRAIGACRLKPLITRLRGLPPTNPSSCGGTANGCSQQSQFARLRHGATGGDEADWVPSIAAMGITGAGKGRRCRRSSSSRRQSLRAMSEQRSTPDRPCRRCTYCCRIALTCRCRSWQASRCR